MRTRCEARCAILTAVFALAAAGSGCASLGRLYTPRSDVRQREEDRGSGRVGEQQVADAAQTRSVQKLTGYVTRIDSSAGLFMVRLVDDGSVLIRLPRSPSGDMTSTFGRLREGSHVRLRIEWLGESEARLLEFV